MENNKSLNKTNMGKKVWKVIAYFVCVVLGLFVLTIASFNIVYVRTLVYGKSMQPLYNSNVTSDSDAGDTVLVNRFTKGKVGDVVVADVDWGVGGATVTVIKRIVAVGGDRLRFENVGGNVVLYKNEAIYTESYINSTQNKEYENWQTLVRDKQDEYEFDEHGCLIVPTGEVMLFGDNREHSDDSSLFGSVSRKKIVGRVDYCIGCKDSAKGRFLELIYHLLIIK